MRLIFAILLLWTSLYATPPAGDWLPNKYKRGAIKYYDSLDSAQWTDVLWHVNNYGIRQGVFSGMEGSNRQRGKHGDEDSYQCLGVYYPTARLYRPAKGLRDSLGIHSFTAKVSAEIDSANLVGHRKRTDENKPGWKAQRPELNAAMAYPGGSTWRNRLVYGMVFMARKRELEKRLIPGQENR